MPYRFNPFLGNLDLVATASGTGNVTGLPPTTPTALARWVDTNGTIIENSLATIQNSGAIEAQGFITRRPVLADVHVNSGESWIVANIELELSGSIEIDVDAEIIIV